jgi:ABC-type Fe3+ transport system substrate-binding protein
MREMTRRAFLMSLAAAGMLAACGQGAAPSTPSASSSGREGWQKQWDAWVDGAKKEGRLILASGPSPDTRVKVPEAFKKAFGVEIEYLGGSSTELANRLRSEQASNQYTVDVSLSGANTAYINFYGEKMMEPLKPHLIRPDVLDPSVWTSGKGVWYMDPGNEYFVRTSNFVSPQIVVNTEFMKADGLNSWDALLKPEYKGKIIALDPTQAGSGGQTGAYLYKTLGVEWVKRFYLDQEPALTLEDRVQADALARGKSPIAVGIRAQETVRLQKDGFKLAVLRAWDPAPGYQSAAFGILGLFKNPPHPNAAKVFLNWILTKEGQTVWNSSWQTAAVRNDVDNAWVPDFIVPKPGVSYFDAYEWEYSSSGWKAINENIKKLLADRIKG